MNIMGMTAADLEKKIQERSANSENKDERDTSSDDDGTDEWNDNVPFNKHPRFIKLLEEAKAGKAAKAELEDIKKREAQKERDLRKERKIDPNMPFDEALKQIKEDAIQEAIAAMREESQRSSSQTAYYENLIEEWFDHLRDSGIKISAKDEDAIAEIALKYNIKIEAPEDLENAYKIFDLSRKTAWSGKARDDSTGTKDRASWASKSNIDYSRTSWSNLGNTIAERLKGGTDS